MHGNTSSDVILLDLMLDDMPGLEVADRIRSDPRTRAIPILALSAEEVPRGTVIERGIDELLIMPVRLPVLIAAMERILEPHRCTPAQGTGRDSDQLEYELSDRMRSDHLTLATCFPAQVRFAVTGGNGPHIEAFKRRLARIGIACDARLQGGDLQITFRPTIAEALSLGLHRSAPNGLLFALLDAYPELGVDSEGLRERVDRLEFAYERLQQLAS